VLQVAAKSGAAPDAEGELAFGVRFDGAAAVTAGAAISIGEGVDLAGVVNTPRTVAAGSTVDAGVRVSNVGAEPVKSAVLALSGWDSGLTAGGGFSNCTYGVLIVCTFADVLATGTTYELATQMRLRIPADTAAGSRATALGSWYTPGDFREMTDLAAELDEGFLGPKGTGAPATLREVPAAASRAAAGQVDTDPGNNVMVSEFEVGGRRPDLAAVGATITGRPGDKVDARVGFRNNGPGALHHEVFSNTDPGTHITVPPGVRAVAVDERCFPLEFEEGEEPGDVDEPSGASEYLCMLWEGTTKAEGSALFDFTFQVRAEPSAEAGRVTINEEDLTGGATLDRDGRNDSAPIAVASGDSGGEGGGLPVTGTDAGLLGAGGAVLLLAGVAGLLLVRRRRLRFTA
jgi:LPXTG-motif cell wall-anchored protein